MSQTTVVDARGTRCPQPVVELARAAARSPQVLLLSDDPVSLTDVPAWCRLKGAELIGVDDAGDHWVFHVRAGGVGSGPAPRQP
ncbi:MAG: sulfurtransferase TusA family protein [Candidatus Nanopelagicales bacterium]|jgi:TusA-related sulfurtransferase|nr:sulfurtransferase TusA family protein [Candidatus Nanopelagicales bacterium]MCU0296539.1 sulfurtransferase TusA family protein [Candidatus Nanopelagicales bacterium]MCU0297723.1 sulfurtransferase TusA family protein [Candidatus Nanopelagicales bacterium]